jgi:hypothetical protein
MAADSESDIAWHRVQLKKHRETLKAIETARFTIGEMADSKRIGQTRKTIADLKRKITQSEQAVAAYEKRARRPLVTDYQSLASVHWSNWTERSNSRSR